MHTIRLVSTSTPDTTQHNATRRWRDMPLRCWAVVKGESGMLLTGMGMRRGWRSSSALVPAHQCMEAVGAMWPMGPYMCCVHVFWLHVGCMASCGLPWMASAPHSARLHPMAGYGGGPDTAHACDVVLGAGAVSNGRKVGPWTTTFPPPRKHRTASQCSKGPT